MELRSNGHWTYEDFTQRVTSKEWKQILLNEQDKIIVAGRCRELVGKRLGAGVVEISKKPLKEGKS